MYQMIILEMLNILNWQLIVANGKTNEFSLLNEVNDKRELYIEVKWKCIECR